MFGHCRVHVVSWTVRLPSGRRSRAACGRRLSGLRRAIGLTSFHLAGTRRLGLRRAGYWGKCFRVESLEDPLHEVECRRVMRHTILDSDEHLELHADPEVADPGGDRLR